ncbi:MAG: pectate lyase [Planctomycetaceae bacterium]
MNPIKIVRRSVTVACFFLLLEFNPAAKTVGQDNLKPGLESQALQAMKRATHFFHDQVAVHGGYVYKYSLDLKHREGEGKASPTEIWVQPPGTPAVGMAFIKAFEATGDPQFLQAAVDAAMALVDGQLESGGWSSSIEFDPKGKHADRLRSGKGKPKGKNYSTLDDDKTQSAICLLMQTDKALQFRNPVIHEATVFALDAMLTAQFANGGFPQGWREPVTQQPVQKASYPEYDWRTENRIKDYWDYYTLNDGLAGTAARTLHMAHQVYGDQKYHDALLKLGDFLILAQLPEPQTGWAQQYNFDMHPMWARKFEPPAVSGRESEDAMSTLLFLYELTGDSRYLPPVESGLAWLNRSKLPDGQIARFYELKTNRPLYFVRDTYELTYDDSNLPTHYGFKTAPRTDRIEKRLNELKQSGKSPKSASSLKTLTRDAEQIINELDDQGRWLAMNDNKPADARSIRKGEAFISSELFSHNLTRLAEYLTTAKGAHIP